jgi:beta-phosphoglucomutase
MAKSKKAGTDREIAFAAIFDMDGVIADTIPYHSLAWMEFGARHGLKITRRMILEHFNGRVNKEIMEFLFKKKLSEEGTNKYAWEKETLYRSIYRTKVRPLPGLIVFLKKLKKAGVKVALATAGPRENVAMVVRGTKTRPFFDEIVDATGIKFGKPHPEIFLKAASKLKVKPEHCVVFEDAIGGIEAARRAGSKVVGLATSHKPKELAHTDLVIKDYRGLKIEDLQKLL